MALSANAAVALGRELIEANRLRFGRNERDGKIRRYLAGDQDLPYAPKGAKKEYLTLARQSITNITQLVPGTFAKSLYVEGYRQSGTADNSTAWDYWQANGMDARQGVAMRGALEYGTSYVLVLPGDPHPLIRPLSPMRTYALYQDMDDEFPAQAIIDKGEDLEGNRIYHLFEGSSIHTLVARGTRRTPAEQLRGRPDQNDVEYAGSEDHGLGFVPMVRFRDRLDDQACGLVWPIIPMQDRINNIVFSLQIAIQYASFRQRWATGIEIPTVDDPESPNHGQPIEPFEAAVNRLWVSPNPEANFGDFNQTHVEGHLNSYMSAMRTLSAVSEVSPLVFLGDLVNLSADALAGAKASETQRLGEFETIFGEAWEQVLRTASLAAGDITSALDVAAQVRWRDAETRSLAGTVDALGKMVTMLQVPPKALWKRIPNTTDQDVEEWLAAAEEADSLGMLTNELRRQAPPPQQEDDEEPEEG